MNKLILFDVDGTLSKSRRTIEDEMVNCLKELKKHDNITLGIVGGSNLEKQIEQLYEENLKLFTYIFSENGLVAYHNGKLINKNSIKDKLGENNIKKLINTSLKYMADIDIPKKRGNFVEFRNGMINLCPVGRSCTLEEREEFFEYDNKENIRGKMVKYLENELSELNLQYSIGGQISIDVFPIGWDKTYCLQFVKDIYDEIYFFGDRTMPGGNDYEIFNHKLTIGHAVTNPSDTMDLLKTIFLF
jgi:phosphomannomutase